MHYDSELDSARKPPEIITVTVMMTPSQGIHHGTAVASASLSGIPRKFDSDMLGIYRPVLVYLSMSNDSDDILA